MPVRRTMPDKLPVKSKQLGGEQAWTMAGEWTCGVRYQAFMIFARGQQRPANSPSAQVLSVEAARRGAQVLAIDLSPTLVDLARDRQPAELTSEFSVGRIDFRSGDMLDAALGEFDYVVGMDSLIHYRTPDAVRVVAGLAERTRCGVLFTYAPSNPALIAMRAMGRLFPRSDRAPWIEPVAESALHRLLAADVALQGWQRGRTQRISSGFYTSQALELVRR